MAGQAASSGIGSQGLPLYTKEQLQASPSLQDGLEPAKELQWRRQYTHFISDVGKTLEVPQWAIYTAVFLCHHYFVKRSMLRSDRYLIATACLYLACKVQENPKYLRDVIKTAEVKKWAKWQKEHPLEQKKWDDPAHLEAVRDQVLVAERAVLYALCFSLRIKTPYPDILTLQGLAADAARHDLVNIAWSLVNDSLQTVVSLLYPPEKLAAAAFFLAHEISGLPLPCRDGAGFCELANISRDELQDICEQLLGVYITVVHREHTPGTPLRPPDARAPSAQPSSPDIGASALQVLPDNRLRLVMPPAASLQQQQQQQQQQPPPGAGPPLPAQPPLPQQTLRASAPPTPAAAAAAAAAVPQQQQLQGVVANGDPQLPPPPPG